MNTLIGKAEKIRFPAILALTAILLFTIGCKKEERAKKPELSCTLSVSCAEILDNVEKLAPEKHGVLPADGVILPPDSAAFSEGESVLDVVMRICREKKIHMEVSETPLYGSKYIEGINNIYQGDCGRLSGWTYLVNGKSPNVGCSEFILKDGDRVEIRFTCGMDMGESTDE